MKLNLLLCLLVIGSLQTGCVSTKTNLIEWHGAEMMANNDVTILARKKDKKEMFNGQEVDVYEIYDWDG